MGFTRTWKINQTGHENPEDLRDWGYTLTLDHCQRLYIVLLNLINFELRINETFEIPGGSKYIELFESLEPLYWYIEELRKVIKSNNPKAAK